MDSFSQELHNAGDPRNPGLDVGFGASGLGVALGFTGCKVGSRVLWLRVYGLGLGVCLDSPEYLKQRLQKSTSHLPTPLLVPQGRKARVY